uniref:alkaline phosphatase n=1 Tax=Sinocyclocheilus grahami TaxID=75366 RepID=A0A672S376_SINGR
ETMFIFWNQFEEEEHNPNFWYVKGKEDLHASLSMKPNMHQAKNLILFLGELKAPVSGIFNMKEMYKQRMFPLLSSFPFDPNKLVMNSMASDTVYSSHTICKYNGLGLVLYFPGKSVGIVSTEHVQHASLAASYSHTPERGWYSDKELPSEAVTGGCKDIAYQLVHNTDINVILGGGRQYMFPKETIDPEYSTVTGSRQDKTSLVDVWLRSRNNAKYVWNKNDFDAVKEHNTDYLMGLFEPKDTRYELECDPSMDPSLTELVEKAIKILCRNSKGFYLFVEDNGRIDHGHHAGLWNLTGELDTLSVVTANHSHVFSFGGYSSSGNPVLAEDGKSFTNALYGNGPGYQIVNVTRPDMNVTISSSDEYLQQAAVPLDSETHGSEDVTIFVKGPMAHLFHGVQEQSYIPHAMAYAACLEPYTDCLLEDYGICTQFSLVVLMLRTV